MALPYSILKNPFTFGKPVLDRQFFDRKAELARLSGYMRDGRNVILTAPRGYGKTSLVLRALSELDGEVAGLYIDCYGISSPGDLARLVRQACLSRYPSYELISFIRRIALGISPKITLETDPPISIGCDLSQGDEASPAASDPASAFFLPGRLAEEKGCLVAIIFDEFQEMAGYMDLLKQFRSAFCSQTGVSCCLLWSRHHLIDGAFSSPESPLYGFGAHIPLAPLDEEAVCRYFREAYQDGGIFLDPKIPIELYRLTKGHPQYLGRIGYELWQRGVFTGAVSLCDLKVLIRDLIAAEQPVYLSLTDSLTANQRKALLAVAAGEKKLYSKDCMRRYGFCSKGSLHAALNRLMTRGIILRVEGGYEVADLLLPIWLAKRFGDARSPGPTGSG